MYQLKPGLTAAGYIGAAAQAGYNFYRAYDNTTRSHSFVTRGRSASITRTKSKQQYNMMSGVQYARSKRMYGRYKRKTVRDVSRRLNNDEEKLIHRFQNVSRFGVGPGAQSIYTWADANNTAQPCHIFDLTAYPNNPTAGYTFANGMYALLSANATGNTSSYGPLPNQDAAGVVGALGVNNSFFERGVPPTDIDHARLRWIDLKMNLYGTFGRPVKYKVMIVGVHDETAVPGVPSSNTRWNQMVDDWIRPYKYSNLLTNTGEQKKSYHVLKQWNYVIQPLNKTEQWNLEQFEALENLNPHFVEFKCFMKMDRDIAYDWHDTASATNLTGDVPATNFIQTAAADVHNTPYPVKRVFLVVLASCADVETAVAPWDPMPPPPSAIPFRYGSYDICLRRCFKAPKA